MNRLRTLPLLAACAAGIVAGPATTSRAQVVVQRSLDGAPAVNRVFPVGWQRGQKGTLTIDGQRLNGAADVLASAGIKVVSVTAAEDKQARLEIEVAADAPLGPSSIYLLCIAGLSNPKLIYIDDVPQTVEAEDNHVPERATPLPTPGGVSGSLGPADVDYFRFEAQAGQQLVIDLAARRLGASLRPAFTLLDPAGREVARSSPPTQQRTSDPRLTHTFAAAGTYRIKLIDRAYQGAEFATYYLRIGPASTADYMFPLGGRRGARASIALGGGNLSAPLVHEFDVPADSPNRRLSVDVPAPSGSIAAPAFFALGDWPEVVEVEPNHDPASLTAVETPVVFNGRIDATGDRDGFKFRASQGTPLVVRVLAAQLGSPVDAVLSIVDANGAELASADDRQNEDRSPPIVRPVTPPPMSADPQIEFTPPADGEYVVFVSDLTGQGGPAYAYRVEVLKQAADFELLVQPSVPQLTIATPNPNQQEQQVRVLESFAGEGAGALSLDRGGSGVVAVRVLREGAVGSVTISVEGLPPGVEAKPVEAGPGQTDVQLNFVADFEAPPAATFARIVGVATVNDQPLRRTAVQPVFLSALPINGATRVDLGTLAVGVSRQGAELAVRGELAAPLAIGGKTNLKVSLRRREGFNGEVTCTLANVPGGFTVEGVAISPESQAAEIEIAAGVDSVVGPHLIVLQGTMNVPDRQEPIVAIFPIEFNLLPLVALELPKQQVDLAQGGEAVVLVKLKRFSPLGAPIELALAPLPKGVTCDTLQIPPDADEFSLVLKAAPDAATSAIRRIVQLKAKTKIGDKPLELPSLRFALKIAKP